jgi:hypothetical protein
MVAVSINIPDPIDVIDTTVTTVSHMVKLEFTEPIAECPLQIVIEVLMLYEYYRVVLNSLFNFCELCITQSSTDINVQNLDPKIAVQWPQLDRHNQPLDTKIR